jgi:hypothetical protein
MLSGLGLSSGIGCANKDQALEQHEMLQQHSFAAEYHVLHVTQHDASLHCFRRQCHSNSILPHDLHSHFIFVERLLVLERMKRVV